MNSPRTLTVAVPISDNQVETAALIDVKLQSLERDGWTWLRSENDGGAVLITVREA